MASANASLLLLVLELLLGSLVLPGLVVLVSARLQPAGRTKLAAFGCLWAGQLAVPLAIVVAFCLAIGRDGAADGALAAVLIYGVGMAAIAAGLTVLSVRMLVLGIRMLGAQPVGDLRSIGTRFARWAVLGIVAALVYAWLPTIVPVPGGRWGHPLFLAFAVVPVGFAAFATLVVAALVRRVRQP